MKKLLLFCSLLLSLLPLSLPAAAETQTITFSDMVFKGATSNVTLSNKTYAIGDFSISFLKGDSSNDPIFHVKDKKVRFYAKATGKQSGNIMVVKSNKESITIQSVTGIDSKNSNSTFNLSSEEDGSFKLVNTLAGQMHFNELTIKYEVKQITTPAGMPEVTINGIAIEEGCFYNISKDSKAEVSATDATSISVLYDNGNGSEEVTGSKGTFDITTSGEYIIESTNGGYGGETLSFNVNIIDPEKTITYTDVWEKVLSTDEITDDGEYILVCETNNTVASNESSANNRKSFYAKANENVLKSLLVEGAETKPLVIEIKKEGESNYYLFASNYLGDTSSGNYLVSGTGSNNHLKVGDRSATNDDALTTIAIGNDGNATISFPNCKNSSNVRTIRYNASASCFATYGSGQTAIQLYKKGEPEQNETLKYSTKEYLDLPDFEHDVTAKKITFTCSNPNVLFEEKHYDATSAQSYAPKAVADGWNAMADGVFDHSAFTNDIILETRAYREDAAGNRLVKSPIHAMRVSASGTVTGIESVAAEAEAEGALYNLQGVRVDRATAAPGLYIERRGGKAVKVIL